MKKLLLIPLLFLSLIALCQPASVKTRPPKDSSVLIANTQYVDLAIRAATNVITVSDSGLFKPYVTDAQGNPFRFAYWPAGFADPLTTNGDIVSRVSGVTTRKAKGSDGTYLGVRGGTLDYYAPSDAELSTSNITTNNATTSKHGFVPILPNDATKYYDGTGNYSTPAGGLSMESDETYSSGSTWTQGSGKNYIQLNPSSVQSTLTITTLASGGTWHNSNDLYIVAGGTLTSGTVITTLTITAGSGMTIIQDVTPTTITAGRSIHYHKIGTFLYRLQD